VYVNGAQLTSAAPYWQNGGGSGLAAEPAGGWNAYFDTGTVIPTLKLDGAVIDTPYISGSYQNLIYADGNIILTLTGDSMLSHSVDIDGRLRGIYTPTDLVIAEAAGETGSLTISITNTNGDGIAEGIRAFNSTTIESGTIDIAASGGDAAYAIYTVELRINGGQITAGATSGDYARGIDCDNFYLTAGSIKVTASASPSDIALWFENAFITGGEGRFESVNYHSAGWEEANANQFSVTGGRLIFSCANGAAFFFDAYVYDNVLPNSTVPIWVSADSGGAGKAVWDSSMGLLASYYYNSGTSNYKYVEFSETGGESPQTGDAQTPRLWLCAGLTALLGAAGAAMLLRRKRRA